MRGQAKNIKSLIISGNVYLIYRDEEEISKAKTGDVFLELNDEEGMASILINDYMSKGHKGFFRAKIYDGREWCSLNNLNFFEDRINQFSKTDICYYTYLLCKARMEEFAEVVVYRTYRDHYTTYLHVSEDYKGKKGNKKDL